MHCWMLGGGERVRNRGEWWGGEGRGGEGEEVWVVLTANRLIYSSVLSLQIIASADWNGVVCLST